MPDAASVVSSGRAPSDTITVSVVVPARNEIDSIDACLQSVLGQDLPGRVVEVLVVDNGSTDGTRERLVELAAADPRLRVLDCPRPSIPRALNSALAEARGRWLVRVDAHSTIPPGYLRTAVDRLEEGTWVGVGGRKDAVAHTPEGRAIAAVLASRLAVGGSVYHHGTEPQEVDHIPFGAYPTALVRELGGWDESIANNEDFELDQRLRGRGPLLFDPALRIEWHCRESVVQLFQQYRRYGTGKPQVAVRHPGSVSLRHLAPPGLVCWLAVAALVGWRRPGRAAAMVAPYAAVLGASSLVICRRLHPTASKVTVPLALSAMQVGWGVGFLQGGAALVRRRAGRGVSAAVPGRVSRRSRLE